MNTTATPPSTTKKKLKLRRLFANKHHELDDDDNAEADEALFLPAEQVSRNAMDTRTLTSATEDIAQKRQQQKSSHQAARSDHTTTSTTISNTSGGSISSSQHHHEQQHKKNEETDVAGSKASKNNKALLSPKTPPMTPPQLRLLKENAKDSRKKARPFPVPIRRMQNAPSNTDPPAAESLLLPSSSPRRRQLPSSQTVLSLVPAGPQQSPRTNKNTPPPPPPQLSVTPASEVSSLQLNSYANAPAFPLQSSTKNAAPAALLEEDDDDDDDRTQTTTPARNHSKTPPKQHPSIFQDDDDDDRSNNKTPLRQNNNNTSDAASLPVRHPREPVPNSPRQLLSGTPKNKPASSVLKAALSRPFGRLSLLSSLNTNKLFVVEVSAAEWDANEQRWKYRILVQKRQTTAGESISTKSSSPSSSSSSSYSSNNKKKNTKNKTASSFTTAFTWRSVADFFWLEKALRQEFHGALLIPVLSIALGKNSPWHRKCPWNRIDSNTGCRIVWTGSAVRGNGSCRCLPLRTMISCWTVKVWKPFCIAMSCPSDDRLANSNNTIENTAGWWWWYFSPIIVLAVVVVETARREHGGGLFVSDFLMDVAMAPLELCVGPRCTTQRKLCDSACGSSRVLVVVVVMPKTTRNYHWMYWIVPVALAIGCWWSGWDSVLDTTTTKPSSVMRGSNSLAIHSESDLCGKRFDYELPTNGTVQPWKSWMHCGKKKKRLPRRGSVLLCRYRICFVTKRMSKVPNWVRTWKSKKNTCRFRKIDKTVVDEGLRAMTKQKIERAIPALTSAQYHAASVRGWSMCRWTGRRYVLQSSHATVSD